jgi:WD40 repeat protein
MTRELIVSAGLFIPLTLISDVFEMVVCAGSANAHMLVTASTDGQVLWWNTSQLSQPSEKLQLALDVDTNATSNGTIDSTSLSGSSSSSITISCIACSQQENLHMVVGTESGSIYKAAIHTRTAGALEEYAGHYGMVTSVDFNPSTSRSLQGLLLSSSVDWTTRLWDVSAAKAQQKPLMSFAHDTYDYVCDVKWSPRHAALFVTANISGELSLWNLNHSVDEPIVPPVKVSCSAHILTALCIEQTAMTSSLVLCAVAMLLVYTCTPHACWYMCVVRYANQMLTSFCAHFVTGVEQMCSN